ncbi:MAG TPA: glutamate synthase subunit beta [Chitinophagales bacterium]|nr:glutamate synthase subunit beta [Chitinophagales bacterium]HMW11711.1 glutamate synthase subunit beta [Chitinophagales bacterium]HMX59145.1 glutamate synthase subunit beta [Chitinophagales bacterium]HMY23063.1 glutamate synthase subunit beta [Chitinophagales bacterium]HMZ33250.1 glutamate synthase subunit beta [Chitinophagales bacterium]
MGKPTGFLEFTRELPKYKAPEVRIKDYNEIYLPFADEKTQKQAARCMDCGVPFCHNGCPLGNIIPEFNDATYNGDWKLAAEILLSTNNFPEFTGRICPAPCESACVLGINQPPVAIEHIEKSIIEKAFELNLIQPKLPSERTGKKVAVVGSGPAGMAAAAQLNKAGHTVTVYERADKIGGLLRYGIPDFKLEKEIIDRRIEVMEKEGIQFVTNTNVGVDITVEELNKNFDAVVLSGGSTVPRDLPIQGRAFKGVYPAMEFLSQQNKRVANITTTVDHRGIAYENGDILATDKHVIVIGGGDTGSDCVGTSNRHGAKSVTQIELLAMPPQERHESTPWPLWPMMLRTSSSHEEGCERQWSILTKEFIGNEAGELIGLKIVEIEWKTIDGRPQFVEIEGTERVLPCDLALLAMGFVHPQHEGLLANLAVALDERGNINANNYKTNVDKIFTAGDMRRGQSLVVWAISEGRECAREVDLFLMGESQLEAKDKGVLFVGE